MRFHGMRDQVARSTTRRRNSTARARSDPWKGALRRGRAARAGRSDDGAKARQRRAPASRSGVQPSVDHEQLAGAVIATAMRSTSCAHAIPPSRGDEGAGPK